MSKVIGVEFRIGLRNARCNSDREIFLHPLNINLPPEFANFRSYPYFNVTVHTSLGDATCTKTDLPVEMVYNRGSEEDLRLAMEVFEKELQK